MKTWRKDVQKESGRLSVMILTAFLLSVLGLIGDTQATSLCREEAAVIVSLQGIVELRRANEMQWQQVGMDTVLCAGDSIRARTNSRAAMRLRNDSMLRLDQKTSLTFPPAHTEPGKSLLDLFEGAIHIITRTPKPFKVRTPFVNASVDGTEFYVGLEQDTAKVVVYEGKVTASNDLGSVALSDHEAAIATRDQAPRKEIIIRPTDAVHWALYYPAIADYVQDDTAATGDVVRQAGRLLTTGQADEAQRLLEQTLKLEPNGSDLYALLAIIAVVQNDKTQALEHVTRAVSLNPQSVTALLAQSYVQQAHFDIEAALDSVRKALEYNAQQALIWGRVAELQMSLGQLERALEAAQQAVKLQPDLAKTQTVLGFAYLLQIDTQTAREIFHRAITLDQADPMPRLGLGIALIRAGELEQGRIELEIAASLDPANSLIRSYLGKAYFEEKRYPLASSQFDLAKERDPKDPTPWFYDAIQKQTQNRPVEALRDIQKSIELNDNRAVYRSRFLLDRDEAARGSSLARIFENLGFERRAVMETAKSLSFDPANHSAHRFLSDTYANTSRHEIARVSELLQAQLLQPINVNPVQPHMAVADLNIITNTGPSSLGFNEFAPLMERNKSQLVASGIVGNQGILGNETVFSKLYDRTSISLGQFHYETNGFRSNNDQNHNIYNVFIQHALSPKLNVQAEVRSRDTSHGDLLMDGDPQQNSHFLDLNLKQLKLREGLTRIGARYALSSQQDFLASAAYIGRSEKQIDLPTFINSEISVPQFHTEKLKDTGFTLELQHLYRGSFLNTVSGFNSYQVNTIDFQKTDYSQWSKTDCFLSFELRLQADCNDTKSLVHSIYPDYVQKHPLEKFNREREKGYIYTYFNFFRSMNAVAGFSYDSIRDVIVNRTNGFNPKFGLQTNLTDRIRLRLAWFETVKSALIANQTLEPTQVAGFNQLFDDINGTRARRQGIGLDITLSKNSFFGVEASTRHLQVPVNHEGHNTEYQKQREELYRAYLYWLPNEKWSTRGEIQYERYSRAAEKVTAEEPTRIDNFNVPLNISYFNAQGFWANLTGTYVYQNIERLPEATRIKGIHDFFVLDTSIGYRLPKRMGVINFDVRNLLDESFFYRSYNFQVNEYKVTRYIPERTFFARITFNF